MKLFYSPNHRYVHKVLVTAYCAGLHKQIEYVPMYPLRPGYDLSPVNPTGKVPTLTLDSGSPLYGSQVICEYLDSLSTDTRLFPRDSTQRWNALRRMALADTTFELTVALVLETAFHSPEHPRQPLFAWLWPKIERALATMDSECLQVRQFNIGCAATLHAITYLDMIINDGHLAKYREHLDWRAQAPRLSDWLEGHLKQDYVRWHFGIDYEGDTTAEHARTHIEEVLAASTGAPKV